jgi:hypothetical protein
MTRTEIAAPHGRILVVACASAAATFSVQVLSSAVRKYLEQGAIRAMIRYWSRFGVGNFARTFDRDRVAVAGSDPQEPSGTASERQAGKDDGR